MKLTPAEYKLLGEVHQRAWTSFPKLLLLSSEIQMAKRMKTKGLISKRAWDRGYVAATALGKRSYSYGKR